MLCEIDLNREETCPSPVSDLCSLCSLPFSCAGPLGFLNLLRVSFIKLRAFQSTFFLILLFLVLLAYFTFVSKTGSHIPVCLELTM